MNLLIITPGKLPVPASKGGAVETLIQTIIDNNEKTHKYNITLISIFDKEASELSKKYKSTKFIFINIEDKFYKVYRGIRFIINRMPNIYIGNEYIKRVYKILKSNKENYDHIIIENSPQYGLVLRKKYNNLILHMHNDFLNENIDNAKKILNSYQKVFSLSNYITKRIKAIDLSYDRVYTLYNGVELDKFDIKDDQNLRKKLNIKDNDFVYLYTGRLVKEKGVKELITAFKKLNLNDIKLVIAGNTEETSYSLKKYIEDLKKISNNNKNIIFTGKIKYSEIPRYYKMANVGIVPSTWEEPFALTVIEHMGVGNPVIISKSGAMPELVNNNCAIIVDKKNDFENNLAIAMKKIKENYNNFNSETIKNQANKFNGIKYCNRFDELISK